MLRCMNNGHSEAVTILALCELIYAENRRLKGGGGMPKKMLFLKERGWRIYMEEDSDIQTSSILPGNAFLAMKSKDKYITGSREVEKGKS